MYLYVAFRQIKLNLRKKTQNTDLVDSYRKLKKEA